ncbi:YceD family protein [Companilactobacillus metriopterae]|uniref:YceD family protein n=1 Tax=Companilactobacillus metriopterae TaxID=1909267 RepID=UPI00100BB8CF|nr:YceD family protein [Companilactobacillus metriopterae]
MLNFEVQDVRKYKDKPLLIEENIDIKKDILDRTDDILDLDLVSVSGNLFNDNGLVVTDLKIKANLVMPSIRSSQPVEVPVDIRVHEVYNIDGIDTEDIDDSTVVMPIDEENPTIDIYTSIIDNILLNLPQTVLTEEEISNDIMPAGDTWEVISEEEYEKRKTEEKVINPELAKLKDLFKNNDEKE